MTLFDNTTGATRNESGTVGGRALRVALALVVIAMVVISLSSGIGAGRTTALGLALMFLGVLTVAAPGSTAPMLLLLLAIAAHLFTDDASFDLGLAALAALLLGIHQLSGICAAVPTVGRVPWRALRPAGLRFLLSAGVSVIGILLVAIIG